MKKRAVLPVLLLFVLIFNSCIGVSMDIQMKRDGSGRINMEYHISNTAESIGRLDGNENWPIIPSGREDLERSVARIEGMEIVSFSVRTRGQDTIITTALEYENPQALLKFLNPAGDSNTSINRTDQSGRMELILSEPVSQEINADLMELAKQVFAGYKFSISFSAERNSTMTLTSLNGEEITFPPAAQITASGRKTEFAIDMADFFDFKDGLIARFEW